MMSSENYSDTSDEVAIGRELALWKQSFKSINNGIQLADEIGDCLDSAHRSLGRITDPELSGAPHQPSRAKRAAANGARPLERMVRRQDYGFHARLASNRRAAKYATNASRAKPNAEAIPAASTAAEASSHSFEPPRHPETEKRSSIATPKMKPIAAAGATALKGGIDRRTTAALIATIRMLTTRT